MPRRPRRLLTLTAAAAICALAVASCSSGTAGGGAASSSATISGGRTIDLTAAACGGAWHPPKSGQTIFDIRNRTSTSLDVELSSAAGVVLEIPTLGPGVDRSMAVTLDPGRYRWGCTSVNGEIYYSAVEVVTGPKVANPSPSFKPVGSDDLTSPAQDYRTWVIGQLPHLAADTDALQKAVDAGRVAGAKTDWLTARLDYERLGAVYDAFGKFNDEINGRPDGLPGGVNDPGFTGFLRLEYGLWHNQPESTLKRVAATLDTDVHGLEKAFPNQILNATDLPLRAHEIIENALQFELTGATDEGSHTNLATVDANIAGDEEVLDDLASLINQRSPQLLSTARSQLVRLRAIVDAYRGANGTWTPVESLTEAEHEQIDAATDAALGTLDQIPAQLELQAGGTG